MDTKNKDDYLHDFKEIAVLMKKVKSAIDRLFIDIIKEKGVQDDSVDTSKLGTAGSGALVSGATTKVNI